MGPLHEAFEERLQEIDAYLKLLDSLERQATEGTPTIGGEAITTQQQRIMYSSVYLQLYNLVEATVTWCLQAICEASSADQRWKPSDLSNELRVEWVRTMAKTHVSRQPDGRLKDAVNLCDNLVRMLPVSEWKFDRRNSGSWDDLAIEKITSKIGCPVSFSTQVKTDVKRKVANDKGILGVIKERRNRLAHGDLSFTECGENVTVNDLRIFKETTASYLREVVVAISNYIAEFGFLVEAVRPGEQQ